MRSKKLSSAETPEEAFAALFVDVCDGNRPALLPVTLAVPNTSCVVAGVASAEQDAASDSFTTLTLLTPMLVELKQFCSSTGGTFDASSVKMMSAH
jgi:hypothetical protein